MIQRQGLLQRLLHERSRRFYENYAQMHPSPLTSTSDLHETTLPAISSLDHFVPQTLDPSHTYMPEIHAFTSPMAQYAAESLGAVHTPSDPHDPISQSDRDCVDTQFLRRRIMTARPTINATVLPGEEARPIPSDITAVTLYYYDLLESMDFGGLTEPMSPYLASILRRQCNPATRIPYAQFWLLTNQERQFMAASVRAYLDLAI